MNLSKHKKKLIIIFTVIALIGGLYGLTYTPQKIITIAPSDVSQIDIFNGGTGSGFSTNDSEQIEHLISNLNEVTFHKRKSSFGYLGYDFRITIFGSNGKKYKEFIINGEDTIRYKGFFYTDKSSGIDYDYLEELFQIKY